MKFFTIISFFSIISILSVNVFAKQKISYQDYKEPTEEKLLELEIEGVYEYQYSSSYLIRLTKKGSSKKYYLGMMIGGCEATAVARSLTDTEFSRPLTYDLFFAIFENTSLVLEHIIITKLEGGVFYANLVMNDNGKIIKIDARPSDSINIAMKVGVPIYTTEKVWADAKEKMPNDDE